MNPPDSAPAPANKPPDKKAPWFPADGAEARIVIAGFFLLFCVLGGYFAVRPVRETIGTVLGRAATQNLWFFTALFAILIVPFYGWLVARVRRSVLLPSIYGFMAVAFAATGKVFGEGTMDPMMARVFYVAISVMNLLLVSAFWSFMLEILSSDQTKRLFGFIAAGGTLGALVGPGATALLVKNIGNAGVLYLGAGMYLVAIVLSRVLLVQWRRVAPNAASAISGPADKDRACMKALLIPEAHLIFTSVGADGTPSYRLETLDDWIARTKSRGHITLEEKQLNFHLETEGGIAHLWSLYSLRSDGKAVARGINSIQAVKEPGGWRVASITVQAESASAPFPEEYVL